MVSIIIPVYQCKKIVSNIIEDILMQTYKDYEVLLVDDGSTDGSVRVCQKYEKKDSRIRVILNEHQGVSKTRNTGITHAKGEYIAFIDSDDRIEPDYLEKLYQNVKNQDLVICMFDRWFYNQDHIIRMIKNIHINAEINMKENFSEYFSELYVSTLLGIVYCKLFRTDIIRVNQIKFRTNLYIGEDFAFNFDYLKKCNNIRCISYIGYHYVCKSENSLTHKKDLNKFEYGKVLFKESIKFADEMGVSKEATKGIYNLYLRTIVKNMELIYQMKNEVSGKEKKVYIRKVLNDESTRVAIKNAQPDTNEFLIYKLVLKTANLFIIGSFVKLRLCYKEMIGRA